jgi:hypothetical protein
VPKEISRVSIKDTLAKEISTTSVEKVTELQLPFRRPGTDVLQLHVDTT